MDIQVARFREVLGLLKPVIPRKSNLPVLTYVLLKDGKAVATDMDTMVIVPVPEADAGYLVPYADVVDMIQYVPGMEYLHIETRDGKVTMSWSDGSSTFGTKNVEDFPAVPEFVPVAEAPIDIDTLIPAMNEVLGFAATETDRPVLNGVTLIMGEAVAVAAGDGYQMDYKNLPLSFPREEILILPLGSVNALKLLWDKTPRTPPVSDSLIPVILARKQATVAIDGGKGLRFVFGDSTTAIVKLVQGTPPAWLKLMPKEEPALKASVLGSQLEVAVRRVSKLSMAGSKIARMEFNEDSVRISARYENQETESMVKVLASQGAPNRVGLNASFLLNYLKGKEGVVSISWVNDGSPISFQHQKSPAVLIMPMMVQWDDSAPTSEAEQPEDQDETETSDSTTEPEAEEETTPAPPEEAAKPRARRGKAK